MLKLLKYFLPVMAITLLLVIYSGKDFICVTLAPLNHNLKLSKIKLPEGFKISIYADNVPGARSLSRSPDGTIFIGTRGEGKVYAVKDTNGDFAADKFNTIAEGLNMPNGVAFYKSSLYVAEVNRVMRYDDIINRIEAPSEPVIINDTFPKDRHHGWKYIAFGPDNKLYVPVGAPCNICESSDRRYASLMRMEPDGSGLEIYAHGVRNTVGFDWNPANGELWFTDNGRDWLGNDHPPDELNHAPVKGMNFGYPYCHGKKVKDPDYGNKRNCREFTPPEAELGAHVASLGIKFYTGKQFPEKYRNNLFIAEHGSWNRNPPSGYCITRIILKKGKVESYSVFASGWLEGVKAWGRPVDLLILPDGSMLVSDDRGGAIYRIHYSR